MEEVATTTAKEVVYHVHRREVGFRFMAQTVVLASTSFDGDFHGGSDTSSIEVNRHDFHESR